VLLVNTRKRVLGEDHPDLLISMDNLALTYRNQGRWKEARAADAGACRQEGGYLVRSIPTRSRALTILASTYPSRAGGRRQRSCRWR